MALTLPTARGNEWSSEVSQGPALIIMGRDSEGLCQESGHGWSSRGKSGHAGELGQAGGWGEDEFSIRDFDLKCQQDTHIS